MELKMECKFCK